MGAWKRCMVSRYDYSIKQPPFLGIQVGEFMIEEPERDHLGEQLCAKFRTACWLSGFTFKFWTTSTNPMYDYDVYVY